MDATQKPPASSRRGLAALAWILLPALALTLPMVVLVREQAPQIRYEELNEAVRGPFWLEHRMVFDGVSTNVAWYGFLVAVYRLFGFDFETARWARVALLAASLIALSFLLHRHLRRGPATLALLAVALSPTILYLNRITTSYGTDLLILPFCLLPLDRLWRRRSDPSTGDRARLAFTLGAVTMIGAMTYPAMMLAVPFLAAWAFASLPRGDRLQPALAGVAGFLLPLAIATLAIRDQRTLYWDAEQHAGIFRGGATGWLTQWSDISRNLSTLVGDLFTDGSSYYFELDAVEFGGILGRAAFTFVIVLALYTAWKVRSARALLATALGAAVVAALGTSAAEGPPGLRRATLVVGAFYLVLATLWVLLPRIATQAWPRTAIAGALLLVPLHHALAYGAILEQSKTSIRGRERVWFIEPTLEASVDHWLSHTAAGKPLDCGTLRTPGRQECSYDYIYSTLAGSRLWNDQPEVEIEAIDPRTGEAVALSPSAWRSLALPAVRNRPSKRPT